MDLQPSGSTKHDQIAEELEAIRLARQEGLRDAEKKFLEEQHQIRGDAVGNAVNGARKAKDWLHWLSLSGVATLATIGWLAYEKSGTERDALRDRVTTLENRQAEVFRIITDLKMSDAQTNTKIDNVRDLLIQHMTDKK